MTLLTLRAFNPFISIEHFHDRSFARRNDLRDRVRSQVPSSQKNENYIRVSARTFDSNHLQSRINVMFETSSGAVQPMRRADASSTARLYQRPHRGSNATESKFGRSSSDIGETRLSPHATSFNSPTRLSPILNWIAAFLLSLQIRVFGKQSFRHAIS